MRLKDVPIAQPKRGCDVPRSAGTGLIKRQYRSAGGGRDAFDNGTDSVGHLVAFLRMPQCLGNAFYRPQGEGRD